MVTNTGPSTSVLQLKDILPTDYANPLSSVYMCVSEIRVERKCRCFTKCNTAVPLCVCMVVHWQPPVQCWVYSAFCLALIKAQRTALRLIFYRLHDTFWQGALLRHAIGKVTTIQCTDGVCLISPKADTTEFMPAGSAV